MILFGCLLAFSAAVAPRVVLILAWIFSNRWPLVWGGDFLLPLLGIIFLPYTTIMYMLAYQVPVGVEGSEWLWVLLGLFLDLWKYSQMWQNRQQAMETTQQYYPSGAPKSPMGGGGASASSATMSTGSAPTSSAPAAPESDASGDAGSAPGSDDTKT